MGRTERKNYVPALGFHWLTPLYDVTVAAVTREARWRGALLAAVAPDAGDIILDVGCGTGTFAVLLKQAAPEAVVIGIDPDPAVLGRATKKAAAAGVEIDLRQLFGDAMRELPQAGHVTKVVSSLVLHQVPPSGKRQIFEAAFAVLRPGGDLHIADFGKQRAWALRGMFVFTQILDGFANTGPNAAGLLPRFIEDAGFEDVQETETIGTIAGSMSLYRARKPLGAGVDAGKV